MVSLAVQQTSGHHIAWTCQIHIALISSNQHAWIMDVG